MSWSGDFLDRINSSAPLTPKWHLEFFEDYHGTIGIDYQISSHDKDYPTWISGVPSTGGGRISPGSWAYTHGGFSVEVTGDIQELLESVQRGNLARLLMGFTQWDLADYQPIAVGALAQIEGIYPNYILTFRDLLTHLQTRHTSTTNEIALFAAIDGASGSTVSTVVAGTYSVADSELEVASLTGIEFGVKGAVIVDGAGFDAFYLTFTGTSTSPNELTGCTGTNLHKTALNVAPLNSTVTMAAWLGGHPMDWTRQILASTGVGSANGAYDLLPKTWGLAVWDEWIDHDDITEQKGIVGNKAGTDHDWSIIIEESQPNAMQWLASVLAPAGIWLVMRQGQISMRCAQNPDDFSANKYALPLITDIDISDADIEEVEAYAAWHPSASAEAFSTIVYYTHGHTGITSLTPTAVTVNDTLLVSLPAVEAWEHDITEVCWQTSNNPATDIAYRCHMWELRVPEQIRLRCRGLRLSALAIGDLVTLTTDRVQGRHAHTSGGYDEVVCMVTAIETEWDAGAVSIELTIPSLEMGA